MEVPSQLPKFRRRGLSWREPIHAFTSLEAISPNPGWNEGARGDTLPGTIMEVEFTTCLYSDNGNARGHLSLPLLFQGDLQSDRRTKTWLFLAGALFPDVSNHWQSGSNHGCVSRD